MREFLRRGSSLRRFFRRDRLTGHVAIVAVGGLCAAAVVFGVGMASAKYHLADVGGWLTSSKKGELVHVNGLSGKVDGKVQINGSAGHPMKVIQQNGVVLIVDEATGVVSRIDPAKLNVVQGASYQSAAGVQLVSGPSTAYALDPQRGTVQRLDPIRLATLGSPVVLTSPLGSGGIDNRATLYVPVPSNGQAATVVNGQSGRAVAIGRPGDDLGLTIAAGSAVVTDFTSARSAIVGPGGTQVNVNLPPQVAQVGKGGVKMPSTSDGQMVPMLAGGSLVLLNSGSGTLSTVSLQVPRDHRLGQPQVLGQRIYIPDNSKGNVLVYNSATNRMERQIPVSGHPTNLDLFVKDGLLWINDPDGSRAAVVDSTGGVKPVSKYSGNVPGGDKNPVPKSGNPGGDNGNDNGGGNPGTGQPGDRGSGHHPGDISGSPDTPDVPDKPGGPPHSKKPKVPDAPQPATNVRAAPRNGGIDVQFQPSSSSNVTYYTLQSQPAFPGADGMKVKPGDTPGFSLKGGDCGTTYSFHVLAHWKDKNGNDDPVPSDDPPAQARPCVAAGAPQNVAATATRSGAKVTWSAPDGANQSTKYTVSWQGPTSKWNGAVSGSKSVTGTSVTLGNVWKNGSYTFTVKATNAAGSNDAQKKVTLTGPDYSTQVHNGGNSSDQTYIRAQPDTNSKLVETMTGANGQPLTVHCQVKGSNYQHPNNKSIHGALWDRLTHKGHTGYLPGYLAATPGSNLTGNQWSKPIGPTIWECAN